MKRPSKLSIAALLIPAVAGGLALHRLVPGAESVIPSQLGALPGRHLQQPWWEAITFRSTSTTRTLILPSDVLFASDSSNVNSDGRAILDNLVPRLREAQSVAVAGCTDSVGGVDSHFNIALGESRARAAVHVLEKAGLPASLFRVVSWADTHPVANVSGLDTATLNALNRRIVLIVTK
jgi:outer membrane protein OmpA-like peptidoglycan-associated protein